MKAWLILGTLTLGCICAALTYHLTGWITQ
jgi:hypothetical protein